MLRKFKKEGFWSQSPSSEALGGGIEMIIEIGIIPEEEVVVEAWIGMAVTGTVEGTKIIVAEVGVAVILLKGIEVGGETVMMMKEVIGADQLRVPLQDEVQVRVGVFHHAGVLHLVVHLVQGVVVQRSAALMNLQPTLVLQHLLRLSLHVGELVVLVAPHLENQLRNEVSTQLDL